MSPEDCWTTECTQKKLWTAGPQRCRPTLHSSSLQSWPFSHSLWCIAGAPCWEMPNHQQKGHETTPCRTAPAGIHKQGFKQSTRKCFCDLQELLPITHAFLWNIRGAKNTVNTMQTSERPQETQIPRNHCLEITKKRLSFCSSFSFFYQHQ